MCTKRPQNLLVVKTDFVQYTFVHDFILIVVPTIYGIRSRFMLVCVLESTKRQNGNIFLGGGGALNDPYKW